MAAALLGNAVGVAAVSSVGSVHPPILVQRHKPNLGFLFLIAHDAIYSGVCAR